MSSESGDHAPEVVKPAESVTLNLKRMGFPGELYSMVVTNIFKEPNAHLNEVPLGGLPGLYQVTFVLGIPGTREFPENEIKFAEFMHGNSHFAILAPAFPAPADAKQIRLAVKVDGESFVLDGSANERG